jgi:hypothetical protein
MINLVFMLVLLVLSPFIGQVKTDLYNESVNSNQPDPDEVGTALGTNSTEGEVYEPFVQLIKIAIAIFSLLLLGLAISAYRRTAIRGLLYASTAFGLFAVQLFFDYLEDTIAGWEQPYNDVIFYAMTLAILIFFFLAVVKRK